MITNINSFKTMEQFFNTGWFLANLTALYIGLKAKLLIITTNLDFININFVKDCAVVIGVISSIAFLGYNISKWYQQILITKKFKRENNIGKLFKFKDKK